MSAAYSLCAVTWRRLKFLESSFCVVAAFQSLQGGKEVALVGLTTVSFFLGTDWRLDVGPFKEHKILETWGRIKIMEEKKKWCYCTVERLCGTPW